MNTGDGTGLLLAADPVEMTEQRAPVPFPDKLAFLRAEAKIMRDKNVLMQVASVYRTHPDWHDEWASPGVE